MRSTGRTFAIVAAGALATVWAFAAETKDAGDNSGERSVESRADDASGTGSETAEQSSENPAGVDTGQTQKDTPNPQSSSAKEPVDGGVAGVDAKNDS